MDSDEEYVPMNFSRPTTQNGKLFRILFGSIFAVYFQRRLSHRRIEFNGNQRLGLAR